MRRRGWPIHILFCWLWLAGPGAAGCDAENVLDGTWGQTAPESSGRFKLVLGQYGPGVAGIVRECNDLLGPCYYCRPLEHGVFRGGTLRFDVQDRDGQKWCFTLQHDGEQELLRGSRAQYDAAGACPPRATEGLAAPPPDQLVFARTEESIDKNCSNVEQFQITVHYGGALAADQLSRVGLLYLGYQDLVPCVGQAVMTEAQQQAARINGSHASLMINQEPSHCYAYHAPGEAKLAFGLPFLYQDADRDGYWTENPFLPHQSETILAFSDQFAVLYLNGRLDDQAPLTGTLLEEFREQSFSLIRFTPDQLDEQGQLTGFERLAPDQVFPVIELVPVTDTTRIPRLPKLLP